MLRRTFLLGTVASLAAVGQERNPVSTGLGSLAYIQDGTLWIKQLPDGVPRALAAGNAVYGPKFSPSGRWILFRDGDELLRLVSVDGKFVKSWTAMGQ
jgi:hypothetical protein